MLDGVLGFLGLSVILDVVDGVLSAAAHHRASCRISSIVRVELVADVLISRSWDAAFCDSDLGRIIVDPCGRGHLDLVSLLLNTVDGVVDGVVGGLGLTLVLDVGQRDGRAARNLGGVRIHGDGIELVAGIGLFSQRTFLDGDHRVLLVDPSSRGVGVASLFGLHSVKDGDVLDGVVGRLGGLFVLDVVNADNIAVVFLKC